MRPGEEKEESFMKSNIENVDDVEEDKDKGIRLNNETLVARELTDWDL